MYSLRTTAFAAIRASRFVASNVYHFSSISAPLVRSEILGNVGIIYLSDPSRLNALTVEMGEQFLLAVDTMIAAGNTKSIRSCIITGDGKNL